MPIPTERLKRVESRESASVEASSLPIADIHETFTKILFITQAAQRDVVRGSHQQSRADCPSCNID